MSHHLFIGISLCTTLLSYSVIRFNINFNNKFCCRQSLNAPACEAIHLTDIESSIECDTFIPPIDLSMFHPWYSSFPVVENGIKHSFISFVRVTKSIAEANDSSGKELTGNDSKKVKFEIENFSFLPKMIFERHEEYQYLNLVQDIIRNGAKKNDRTGTGTVSKFGCQVLSHDIFVGIVFDPWRAISIFLFLIRCGST